MQARQDPSRLLDSILQLRTSPLFRPFSAAQLTPLAYHAREVRFPKGAVVAQQAELWNQFCHILEGTIRASSGEVRGIREALGGLALFSGTGMPFEVLAEDKVRALMIPGDAVFEALEDDFQLLLQLLRVLAGQLVIEREKLGGAQSVLFRPIGDGISAGDGELDLVQKMLLIQRAQALQHASATALADAARNATPLSIPKGELVWRRGDVAKDSFVITSGTVSALYSDRSPIRLGSRIGVGLLEALAGIPRRHDLIAEEELRGLQTPLSRTVEAWEDHFQMATGVLAAIAHETLKALCPGCVA
jgi:CRP-like cAMP-binding protein